MRRTRRLKKDYSALYDNPFLLFGNGPDNAGAQVTLWPNGQPEIWIQDATGKHSVCITASNGPAGLGLIIRTHGGTTPLTVRAYDRDYKVATDQPSVANVREVCLTAYNSDPRSQAFSRWYDGTETPEDIALLGETYRRVSREPVNPLWRVSTGMRSLANESEG